MSIPELPRDEIEALLVFLANGTLEGDERAAVEAAVAADPALQTELAALKAIRAQMQDEAPGASPGEFGLARLMRDVEAEPRQVAAPATPARLWRVAAVAAIALLAVQTVFVWTAPDAVYDLAGGGVESATGPALTVGFAPEATEGEIRALLLELELTIVDGPSALGLYTLAAPDAAARDAALSRLSGTALVETADAVE